MSAPADASPLTARTIRGLEQWHDSEVTPEAGGHRAIDGLILRRVTELESEYDPAEAAPALISTLRDWRDLLGRLADQLEGHPAA